MNDKPSRMDYRQHQAARRLVHECCNYDEGNCLLLDDGEPCVCVQSIDLPAETEADLAEIRKNYMPELKDLEG